MDLREAFMTKAICLLCQLDSAAKKCENEKDKELLEEVHDVLWHFLKS